MTTTESSFDATIPYRTRYGADEGITWVICCLAFFSNLLTIVTMIKTRNGIGQKARLYVISLAVSDILMVPTLILELLMSRSRRLFRPIFDSPTDPDVLKNETIGNITLSMMYFTQLCSSLFILLAVAIDRLCALVKPLKYKAWITDTRIKLLIFSIWAYVTFAGGWIFIYTGLTANPEAMLATYSPIDYLPPVINSSVLMPHMYAAILASSVVYTIAYLQFKKIGTLQQKTSNKRDEIEHRNIKRNRRFFRMVVASVGMQVLLWTPFTIMYNFLEINQSSTPAYITDCVQPFVCTVTICNSFVNPMLYSVTNSDYRRAYCRVLTGFRVGTNSVGVHIQTSTLP
ncbi:hypothetical protein CAPTEDRAFT_207540 [Capitella teleta]|uniref:G-protein coupled receptors family 1 profile domain-containing protein n=1 Tax=Capitella teleta TaxID=283909 RepID=R7VEV4_CAPTE|nr:hypothetical protein CAPTEDRAFT_207540 [Capitella teleta]|eukprot:ELU14831.1 hypothetical protein CAPTEDRAFT_207540 [Capitella teleta]